MTKSKLRAALLAGTASIVLSCIAAPSFADAAKHHYAIPSENLGDALRAFGLASGRDVVFDPAITSGKTSRAVSGDLGDDDALTLLMAGSGLSFDHSATGYIIRLEMKSVAAAAPADDTIVIITATKRKTPLMTTPVAVTNVNQAQLTESGTSNIFDVAKLVPDLQMGRDPNAGGVQIAIRGVSSNNFTEFGSSSVSLNADGFYLPRSQAALALMFDTDRVEVLRGPQGTLYGRNSPGGAINLVSALPDFKGLSGGVTADIGNYNQRQISGYLNVPVTETLALRGAFMVHKRDGWVNQTSDTFDWNPGGGLTADGIPNTDQRFNHPVKASQYYYNADDAAGRVIALYKPTETFSVQLTDEVYADWGAGVVGMPDCNELKGTLWACGARSGFSPMINAPGKVDMTQNSLRSLVSWEFTPGIVAQLRVGSTVENRSQIVDNDAGYFPIFTQDPRVVQYNGAGGFTQIGTASQVAAVGGGQLWPYLDFTSITPKSRYASTTTELLLQSKGDQALKWTVGYFDLHEKNSIDYDIENPICCNTPPVPQALTFDQPDRQILSHAIFGQADYAATDKLNFTLGYRYTWDKQSDTGGKDYSAQAAGWYGGTYTNNAGTFNPLGYQSWAGGYNAPGSWYQSNNYDMTTGIFGNDLKQVSDNTGSAHWSKGTYRVGADYTIDKNDFIYASVSTGYRAGGFQDKVDICNCGTFAYYPWKPETVQTFEVGYKARLFDNRLTLTTSAFHSNYTNMQVTSSQRIGTDANTGKPLYSLITNNVGKSEISGLEVEYNARLWQGAKAWGYATYMPSKVLSDPDQSASWTWACAMIQAQLNDQTYCADHTHTTNGIGGLIDAKGNKLPYAPEESLSANLEQKWSVGASHYVSATVSYHWQSKEYFTIDNFDVKPYFDGQAAYGKVDLVLRYAPVGDAWYAELYGYNLGNVMTKNSPNPESSLGVQQRFQWDDPRFIGLRLGYKFQ